MLKIAVTGNPRFEISFVDIWRQPPYYARDTIYKLRERYADDHLFFLMGSDSLINLPGWYHPQELVGACDGLGVMIRPEAQIDEIRLEEIIPGLFQKVKFISAPLIEISSSDIRRRIAQGEPFRYYLHPEVYEYLRRQNCYHA
jgi:nicotinate-nucleotide adenylyltransferase